MDFRRLLMLAFLSLLLVGTSAHANIYLKVDGPGQYTVTNSPGDADFVKVVETTSEDEQVHADQVQEAVERAEGRYNIPQSLIFSILRNFNGQSGSLMPLPPNYIEEHGDTILNKPEQNILVSTEYFQRMLRRYEGNMTLTLAAYYGGPERVDEIGGVPTDGNVSRFISNVQETFDKFDRRSAIIYTYKDENGTLHVVNIR